MIALLQPLHGLHRERYSDKPLCLCLRERHVQIELAAAIDHFSKNVINRIKVNSSAMRDGLAAFARDPSQKLRSEWTPSVVCFGREDAIQIGVMR